MILYIRCIKVWSIFKRKRGLERGDGNPLIYALKNEKGWKFETNKDKEQIEKQFNKIATKFSNLYKIGVTILLSSGNFLNRHIADVIASKSNNIEILDRVITKITTEDVYDIVLEFDSKFRKFYKSDFKSAFNELCDYLDDMDEYRDGYFTRHFIKNDKMRDVLDITLKASEERRALCANKINNQDILLIDDSISRGQTIKEAINIIKQCYSPKSITVLTLLSKVYNN